MKRGSSLRRTEWPKPRTTGGASGMGLTQLLGARRLGADRGFAAQGGRPVLNGFDDVDVARTPTQVARDTPPDLRLGRVGQPGQQGLRAEQHARRAESALQAVFLDETLLQRVQLAVVLQTFDRFDLAAVGLNGQQGARLD